MSVSLSAPSRPLSRPSSRDSIRSTRAHSPSVSSDGPVAVRHQMSALKHSIRHQQAQLISLENIVLRGPRPLPPGIMGSPPHSPDDLPDVSSPPPAYSQPITASQKMQRRSSFDVLQGLAGPESSLPLPRRDTQGTPMKADGIPEGIPVEFGNGSLSPTNFKRSSSPTRTLSRIPKVAVGNARALADEGQSPVILRPTSALASPVPPPIDPHAASLSASTSSLQPPSPNRRVSLTPGGTTKVLADLQTGVINARNALENTKGQLRLSQRSVAQLTRQTEDLKEVRERLRLENEGLNNVVARKERLLQEVLERARKAEAEAAALKTQLKTETTISKKTLRDMEAALAESSALSQKSEREYITLRDSIKGMVEGWKTDTEKLRDEMSKREEKWRKQAEEVGKKYKTLVEGVRKAQGEREDLKYLKADDERIRKDVEERFRQQIEQLRAEVIRSSRDSDAATQTAKDLAVELARLRRLMQSAGRSPTEHTFNDAPP